MNKLKKLSVIVLIICSIFANNNFVSGVALAEDQATSSDGALESLKKDIETIFPQGSYAVCQEKLTPLFDVETLIFFKFLDGHFQNKSANSSLLNIAILRYSEYKKTLEKKFSELKPVSDDYENKETHLQKLEEYLKCGDMVKTYQNLAKEAMIRHIQNTAYEKKAAVLLEKYQAINNRLRELSGELSRMYAFFGTLNNRLPGFLKDCITN